MKQLALTTQDRLFQLEFEQAEIVFLREESYSVNTNGTTTTKKNNFLPIDKNLRFAYLMLAKGFSLSRNLEVGGKGWMQFSKAKKVRHRLTHPKWNTELIITDDEMSVLSDAIAWFDSQTSLLFADIRTAIQSKFDSQKIVMDEVESMLDELESDPSDGKRKIELIREKLDGL